MKKISIYLAGNVRNERHEDVHWRDEFKAILKKNLPGIELIFFDPTHRGDDVGDCMGTFGRDAFCVSTCNFGICLADLYPGV